MDLRPYFEAKYPTGFKGGQCGVFAHKLVEFPLVGDTARSKTEAVRKHGILAADLKGNYKPGDVLIQNSGVSGHVAVVNAVFGDNLCLTESNYHLDGKVTHKRLVNKWLGSNAGVIRGTLKIEIPTPMITHRICVLFNRVKPEQLYALKTGVASIQDRVASLGDIRIEVDYLEIDRIFRTVNGTNTDNAPVVYVSPFEIGEEGIKAEQHFGKNFDLVCLIYNPDAVEGNRPTNPVESPHTFAGFNVNQIPTSWFETYTDSVRLFFYHEMLHSWYYIINSELGVGLADQVHYPPAGGFGGDSTIEGFIKFFDSLALSLKPWWGALQTDAPNQVQRGSKMFALNYNGTVYVAVFAKFVPIADQDTFLELGGDWASVKKITEAEFNSIVRPFLAKSTVLR